jgi:tripartite-type tricarboxylate transporter receptor subunit TctC
MGTPEPAVKALNAAFNKALQQPAVRNQMLGMGITPIGGTAEALGRHIRTEYTRWAELIKSQGITGD